MAGPVQWLVSLVAAGDTAVDLPAARHSLLQAREVADAAAELGTEKPYVELADVGLPGVLHLLSDQACLRAH